MLKLKYHNVSRIRQGKYVNSSNAVYISCQDLNSFEHGHFGRYRHQIDGLLRDAGDDLANVEDNIAILQQHGYPAEALQDRCEKLFSLSMTSTTHSLPLDSSLPRDSSLSTPPTLSTPPSILSLFLCFMLAKVSLFNCSGLH